MTSLAEYVSYSYLTILDLFLNANQQEDYESCINAQVLRDPKTYCQNHLKANEAFLLWNQQQKETECIQSASAITSAGLESDGCAIVMARLYKSYQRYLNEKYASYFQDYEKKIF